MDRTSNEILRFLWRTLLTGLPVVVVFIAGYILADPYHVVRSYDAKEYFPAPATHPARLGMNKGIVTFADLGQQEALGHRYNAFIFGSSISCYYDADEWASLAAPGGKISPFHFDSAGESLMSMADKAEYLERTGHRIDYALVVLDPIIMAEKNRDSPPYLAPPQLHKNVFETLKFHYLFFRAATNADFLKSAVPSFFSETPVENGRNMIFEPQPIVYDPLRNQETIPDWEAAIKSDPKKFYSEHSLVKSPTEYTVSDVLISGERRKAVERIAGVFERQHTDFKILVGPNRRKVILNPADARTLEKIFGKERIGDYSLKFVNELENDSLLYDNTHYRPVFASRLMHQLYLPREGM